MAIVGIDLGTTNSLISVFTDDGLILGTDNMNMDIFSRLLSAIRLSPSPA